MSKAEPPLPPPISKSVRADLREIKIVVQGPKTASARITEIFEILEKKKQDGTLLKLGKVVKGGPGDSVSEDSEESDEEESDSEGADSGENLNSEGGSSTNTNGPGKSNLNSSKTAAANLKHKEADSSSSIAFDQGDRIQAIKSDRRAFERSATQFLVHNVLQEAYNYDGTCALEVVEPDSNQIQIPGGSGDMKLNQLKNSDSNTDKTFTWIILRG